MVRQENAEKSSSKDLMFEERPQRHSEVVLSPRHPREQERKLLKAEIESTEAEQPRSAPTTRASELPHGGDGANDDWSELPRVSGLLPLSSGTDLRVEPPALNLGPPPSCIGQPSSIGHRVLVLERQRRVLVTLLGTGLVSIAVVYATSVQPDAARRVQRIAQLQQANAEQRAEHARERAQLLSQITKLNARFGAIRFQLGASAEQLLVPADKGVQPVVAVREAPTPIAMKGGQPVPSANEAQPGSVAAEAQPLAAADEVLVAASEAAKSSEASEAAKSSEASEAAKSSEVSEVAQSPEVSEAAKPLNLEEAIKAAVSKESTKAGSSKDTRQPPRPTEPQPPAATGCDRNDPLCGDLNS